MKLSAIGSFLERYEKIFSSQTRKKDAVKESIFHTTGVSLTNEQITIDGDRVQINAPHPIKNEIFFHKTEILAQLRTVELFRIQ